MAALHVTVGLPAAGKTTLARRLAAELPALRLNGNWTRKVVRHTKAANCSL